MRTLKTNMLTTLALGALAGSLFGCTKSIPYKEVFKEKVTAKSEIDTSADYMFVASTDTASRDEAGNDVTPYYQGNERVVRFRFTEKTLQVLAVDTDGRASGGDINNKVIVEIPIKHVEYRCAEDRYKKCTNREEENNEKTWSAKSQFIPDFDGLKTTGITIIPVEMDKIFGSSCLTETASRAVGYELTADALNIQIQKSFKADLSCLSGAGLSSLTDLESQVIFHYSFVRLDKLTTKGYKAISYPKKDESTFGFFTTENRKFDVDLNRTEALNKLFMNRWNPERKEVVYYLTDNFDKPQFRAIKAATQLAFKKVNDGLEKAGVDFRLTLKDPAHKQPGDIRNSMIVMVEDPIISGPLGYGPTVANPLTGEIVSGRVVMYYGNLLTGVKNTYDEVVKELLAEKSGKTLKSAPLTMAGVQAPAASGEAGGASASRLSLSTELSAQAKFQRAVKDMFSKTMANHVSRNYMAAKGPMVSKPGTIIDRDTVSLASLRSMKSRDFNKAMLQTDKMLVSDDPIALMSSRHCNYPSELFPFDEAIANAVKVKIGENPKYWVDLTADEKEEMIALIAPEIWVPTLVHELGHNLGLRHNFGGSEDKANFYNADELKAMGVDHEVPYSSVMDYGYSELNLLPTLGKYDIAALRYGYKREVETSTGDVLSIPTTLDALAAQMDAKKIELKDYQYCTDEHVEVNPNCKRFDKGTNAVEIIDFMINQYEDYYRLRNFRNGRENFSVMSDVGYYSRIRSSFGYMRAFMERYESIRARFHLADDAKEWEEIDFLKQTKQAALKAGSFLASVLKVPDTLCAIAPKANPNQIIGLLPLSQISLEGIDCFLDARLNNSYVVVGQAGKSFNHRKSPRSSNNYADQIDQRGIWLDKLAAARALFNRRIGNSSYDKVEDNFLDLSPQLTEEIADTVNGLLLNQTTVPLSIRAQDGTELLAIKDFPVEMFTAPEKLQSESGAQWIDAHMSPNVSKVLGVPARRATLQEVLLGVLNTAMPTDSSLASQSRLKENRAFMNTYKVTKASGIWEVRDGEGSLAQGTEVKNFGDFRVIATAQNELGQQSIIVSKWGEQLETLDAKEVDLLINDRAAAQKLADEAEASIAAAAKAGETAKVASKLRKAHLQIPINIVKAFKAQTLPSSGVLNYLLTILPN